MTALFLGLFFFFRNLPSSECGFLHYTEVYNPRTGETELCAVAPASFLDLVAHPFPLELVFEEKPEVVGQEGGWMNFQIKGPEGSMIEPGEIGITHTEKVHILLVDAERSRYLHLHPEVSLGGSSFRLLLPALGAGDWVMFAEFVPLRTRKMVMLRHAFSIEPSETAKPWGGRAMVADTRPSPNGLRLEKVGGGSLVAGRDQRMVLRVFPSDSLPVVDLEPVMDAYAHLVAFEDSLHGYIHMHPLAERLEAGRGGELDFLFHPPKRGSYQIWVQLQVNGEQRYEAFWFEVG
ncbi:MAG: hypothetical protein ACFCU4_08480 [Puniceicoccaceae bacterium]